MRVFLLSFLLMACTGPRKEFKQHIEVGRCDEAMLTLPERDPMVRLANRSEQTVGTVLSYAFVGASYTTEVLWDVAGGTVMAVALCGLPIIAASQAYVVEDRVGICFPGQLNALGAPPLGRKALAQTEKMRCPEMESLSRSLRQVASCFEARGGKENLNKAEQTLKSLTEAKDVAACLPAREYQDLSAQLSHVRNATVQ